MKYRYDWLDLKDQFCRGQWLTVADFLRDRNIPNTSYTRGKAKGWRLEKNDYIKKVIAETQDLSVKTVATIRVRQAKLAQELQEKGMEGLVDLQVEDCDTARKMLVDGLVQEREAIGINNHNTITTQLNFSVANPQMDQLVAGKSYEQILEMVALVKREQERRQVKTV